MTRYSEQPRNMRNRIEAMQAGPMLSPAELPGLARPRGSRRMGNVDPGTVGLAMTGMAFYWLPMLMASKRRRKKKPKADA
ncbi:MAG: hypothetical protein ACRDG3_03905 [Tepidiformaceae bacterium]